MWSTTRRSEPLSSRIEYIIESKVQRKGGKFSTHSLAHAAIVHWRKNETANGEREDR